MWRYRGSDVSPDAVNTKRVRLLAAYEIVSQRNRNGRYYDRRDFEDAWASYCADPPPESVTTVTPVTPLESKEIL
jgi:hypothetical protein